MPGKLFTEDFLQTGITATAAWQGLDPARLSTFGNRLRERFARLAEVAPLNEAATESELIIPILEVLGWAAWLPQQTASGQRRDVPDILLLTDPAAKQRALAERREEYRYRHGRVIVEAKRWQRALDRSDASDPLDPAVPSNQIPRPEPGGTGVGTGPGVRYPDQRPSLAAVFPGCPLPFRRLSGTRSGRAGGPAGSSGVSSKIRNYHENRHVCPPP